MPIQLVLTAALSLHIPEAAVEHAWGRLVHAPHYTGTWSVTFQGRSFAGDWAVVDQEPSSDPHIPGYGSRRWVHFVSSTTADYCVIDAEGLERLHCSDATRSFDDAFMPAHVKAVDPTALDTSIMRHAYVGGSVSVQPAGSMRATMRSVKATLSKEQMLFGRIHKQSLANALDARATVTPTELVLTMPYHATTKRPATLEASIGATSRYDQEIVEYQATIRIGPDPTAIAIDAVETGRYVERCEIAGYHGSCSPPMPRCTRL